MHHYRVLLGLELAARQMFYSDLPILMISALF
jgi:hypothetical protein